MNVQLDDRLVEDGACGDVTLPLKGEWNPDSPFERCALATPKWRIDAAVDRGPSHRWPAIVADEEDERIFVQSRFTKFLEHLSDRIVHRRKHRGVRLPLAVSDGGKFVQAHCFRLHRRVNGIERQIQEERIRLMSIDERNGLATERCGQVCRLGMLLGPSPDRSCSFVKIGVRSSKKTEEFIETPFLRVKRWTRTQMPFSHQSGCVTRFFESICDRRFRKW